jgi:hypothetical protein
MKKTSEAILLAQMSEIRYILAMCGQGSRTLPAMGLTVTKLVEQSGFSRDHVEWSLAKLVNDKKVIRVPGGKRQEPIYQINRDVQREDAWMWSWRFRVSNSPKRQTECSRCGVFVPGGRHGRGRKTHLLGFCNEMMIRNILEK